MVCFAPRRSSRFICAQMWGPVVPPAALPAPFSYTLSPALSVYPCATVGPQGLLVVRLPAPFVPHSASLGSATATRVLSAPVPVSAPPTGLDVCLFFVSLISDFLAVRFPVCSGCVRRCSVSMYAAILVSSTIILIKILAYLVVFPTSLVKQAYFVKRSIPFSKRHQNQTLHQENYIHPVKVLLSSVHNILEKKDLSVIRQGNIRYSLHCLR